MPLSHDPTFYNIAAPALTALHNAPGAAAYDIQAVCAHQASILEPLTKLLPSLPEIEETHLEIPSYDGYKLSIYRIALKPTSSTSSSLDANPEPGPKQRAGPAIIHAHGGGTIYGSAAHWTKFHHTTVKTTGVPVFSVGYRLAPDYPYPKGVEDVYAVLKWVHEQGRSIGVDSTRIATMGESAGGGLAAAVAIMARDRGLQPPLKRQILICPMLDDRNVIPDPNLEAFIAPWSYECNITAWSAYLGKKNVGRETVSPYASPARVGHYKGLAAAYIDVGGLDIFRDESLEYAARLAKAGVDVEVHVYAGLPHLFEVFGFGCPAVGRALGNRLAAIGSL